MSFTFLSPADRRHCVRRRLLDCPEGSITPIAIGALGERNLLPGFSVMCDGEMTCQARPLLLPSTKTTWRNGACGYSTTACQICPIAVEKGESVPVARWIGTAVAAVLHVQWMWGSDDPDDDYLASEVVCFSQVDGAWPSSGASGGTGWPSAMLGRSDSIGPTETQSFGVHGEVSEAGRCMATFGITGTAARFIEVETQGRVDERRLNRRLGRGLRAGTQPRLPRSGFSGMTTRRCTRSPTPPWP